MSLIEEQIEKEKYQKYINNVLKALYRSGITFEAEEKYRLRIMNMATTVDLAESLSQKAQDISKPERDVIKTQIKKGTPVEQLVLYLNAPRESTTLKTREDISKTWNKEDAEAEVLANKDLFPRAQNAVVGFGSLMVIIAVTAKVVSIAHPEPFFDNTSESLKIFREKAFGGLSPLNPITSGVAALAFVIPLFMRYRSQRNMTEIVLNKPYNPDTLLQHLQNSPQLQAKLDEIHPSDQVLIQHLATPLLDEKLRLFLTSNNEVRKEILERYPPPYQARMDNVFRRYHLENKNLNLGEKLWKFPKRFCGMVDLQWAPVASAVDGMLERLEQRRQKSQQSSSSNQPPKNPKF